MDKMNWNNPIDREFNKNSDNASEKNWKTEECVAYKFMQSDNQCLVSMSTLLATWCTATVNTRTVLVQDWARKKSQHGGGKGW